MVKAVNGSATFTFDGRKSGGDKAREMRTGWPEWKLGTIEKILIAEGRRFDEPGMEVKFKPKLGW